MQKSKTHIHKYLLMVLSTNVMNIISKLVSVCLLEQNISIPAYFDVPLHTISGYSYLYIYIYMYVLLIKKKTI